MLGADVSDLELVKFVSPEARVLLASIDRNPAVLRAAAGETLDWSLLLLLAERERATSVLWSRLSDAGVSVPADAAETFRRLSLLSRFAALRIEESAHALLRALAARGIEVVLLKGAALAHAVYRGFAERPMGDLDILVDAARAPEAWELAQTLGWRWDPEVFPASRYAGHHHYPPLVDPAGGRFGLEIHSAGNITGHPFALTFGEVRALSRRLTVEEGHERLPNAFVLDEAHQVVHLSVHCAWAHQMKVGVWRTLRDLHALAGSGRVDWECVVEAAQRYHAVSSCYWVLRLGVALTHLEVPPAVITRLSDGVPRLLRGAVARHLVAQMFPTGDACPSVGMQRAMWSHALNPAGQGIGTVRPWDADEPASEELPRPLASVATRTVRQFGSVRAWWRYLRVLATPT